MSVYAPETTAEFERLVQLEPGLRRLEDRCRADFLRHEDRRWETWTNEIKPMLIRLVGWRASGPADVRTEQAYDVVYRHLTALLGI